MDTTPFDPTNMPPIVLGRKRKKGRPRKMCGICGQPMKGGIALHKCIGRPKGSFKCPHTDCRFYTKGFDIQRGLTRHLKRVHTPAAAVKCPECDKVVKRKEYLQAHMLKHRKTPHKCNDCDFCTFFKAALVDHINAQHTHAIEYECGICAKTAKPFKTFSQYRFNKHNARIHRALPQQQT